MTKFIEVDNQIISIESISKAKFISDDIYLGDFPRNEDNQITIDYLPFKFGEIELYSGEIIKLQLDLYVPDCNENEIDWLKANRALINMSWNKLKGALGEITKVTGLEYDYR